MIEKEELLQKLNNILAECVPRDFAFVDSSYYLIKEWGYVRMSLAYGGSHPANNTFNAGITCIIRINQIEEFWEDFSSDLNISFINHSLINPIHTFSVSSGIFRANDQLGIDTSSNILSPFNNHESGLANFKNHIKEKIDNQYIPLIKESLNIKYLDKSINESISLDDDLTRYILNSDGLIFRRTILAKISGNSLFEDICNYQRSAFSQYGELSQIPKYAFFKNIPYVYETVVSRLNKIQTNSSLRWNI
ncbi:hypothetical protein [Marinoscillum pacificum]|uniref:hypothetical protein n=1 Tax=Marinoscillum pacificum TaxID=392723 RepID=UPI00215842B2|nr:hypothetical protein [Marinoscillum pacificum]